MYTLSAYVNRSKIPRFHSLVSLFLRVHFFFKIYYFNYFSALEEKKEASMLDASDNPK